MLQQSQSIGVSISQVHFCSPAFCSEDNVAILYKGIIHNFLHSFSTTVSSVSSVSSGSNGGVWRCNQQRLLKNLISKGLRGIVLTGCWERDNSVFWRRIKGPSLQEPRGDSGNWYGTQHHQTNWCSFSQEIIRKLSPALGKTSNSALQTLSKSLSLFF